LKLVVQRIFIIAAVCLSSVTSLNNRCDGSDTDPTEPSVEIIQLLNAAMQANAPTTATPLEEPQPRTEGYRLRAIVLQSETRGVAIIESPAGSRHRIVLRQTLPQQPIRLQIGDEVLELVSFSQSQVIMQTIDRKPIMIGN
jgi:hypothetical protein